ncbi:hypothetical protein FSP39_014914 [Pinctada imbricata]|uniref:GDH/6PGL endoplasmic bifunctional protein n=1 Tax=Pinctada imbricata TaxID=66713 RepID=A0AA88YDT0_PINIB|nr:hypothetical protein FSP39_014914 [Pinctada imbricata]
MKFIVPGFILLTFIFGIVQATEPRSHTDIILAGALGDLSKKYLWQGLFQLYSKFSDSKNTIAFYGVSRDVYEVGAEKLNKILQERVTCKMKDDTKCERRRHEFIQKVRYFQLKADEHFRKFGTFLNSKSDKLNQSVVQGRIFYLALPPSTYTSMAEKLHNCCLLRSGKHWTRIALEKPFGSDTNSAKEMAEGIGTFFKEEEIYRVDHYLGKSVVKQILPFRLKNKDALEPILNSDHVDRVELVMKENFGVKGRFEYYNQYGVIRDVMQNHLTELLALVAMNLPSTLSTREIESQRMGILNHVQPLTSRHTLIGQYSKYISEAQEEGVNASSSAMTPTFGAAVMYVDNARWRNVPFLVISGKQLDEKSSYIRIVFKDKEFCVSSCTHLNGSHFHGPKQIIFHIGHGSLPSPGILVSKNLFKPKLPPGLSTIVVTSHDSSVYGLSMDDFNVAVPIENNDAYVTVIEDLYLGHQQSFVSTGRLMTLWEIWTPVLSGKHSPKMYMENADFSLNFQLNNGGIEFTDKYIAFVESPSEARDQMRSLPPRFLGHKLVVGSSDELYQQVAEEIYIKALSSVTDKKSFHIAFSGGTTPIPLYRALVTFFPNFPWTRTHIWQVDERCVLPTNSKSNFKVMETELLQKINIPYHNVHSMPVFLAGEICSDRGVKLYRDDLTFHLINNSFDLVVLGVGSDGHTASLFPRSSLLDDSNSLVTLTSDEASPRRLTLSYKMINKSKFVIAIVTGKSKHDIVEKLSEETKSKYDYPILGVNPTLGNMTFFIDNDAWFGE